MSRDTVTRTLRTIVVLVIQRHHLMFQYDNGRLHVASICTQFLEAENVPVLPWPVFSPDMSPIEHVWEALDWRVRQCVLVPPIFSNFSQPLKWDNIPQATINSLINSMWRSCKWWSHQILTLFFLIHAPTFFYVSVTKRCISAFPVIWTALKNVAFIFLFSIYTVTKPLLHTSCYFFKRYDDVSITKDLETTLPAWRRNKVEQSKYLVSWDLVFLPHHWDCNGLSLLRIRAFKYTNRHRRLSRRATICWIAAICCIIVVPLTSDNGLAFIVFQVFPMCTDKIKPNRALWLLYKWS